MEFSQSPASDRSGPVLQVKAEVISKKAKGNTKGPSYGSRLADVSAMLN